MSKRLEGHVGFDKGKHSLLTVIIGSILLFSTLPSISPAMAADDLEYTLGSASGYTSLGDCHEGDTAVGTVYVYDSGGVLHIGIHIWAKPYFAWGEKDKDGNGTVEPEELRSDGIKLIVFGTIYEWWVDPGDPRDPAFQVPSYPDGINSEPILYLLNLEIPEGYSPGDTVQIKVDKVHVSPKEFVDPTPPYPIPEIPVGTALLLITSFIIYLLPKASRDRVKTLIRRWSSKAFSSVVPR